MEGMKHEEEKERENINNLGGGGVRKNIFGFEGSQAVSASSSGKGEDNDQD
jgi:hypothetical protein